LSYLDLRHFQSGCEVQPKENKKRAQADPSRLQVGPKQNPQPEVKTQNEVLVAKKLGLRISPNPTSFIGPMSCLPQKLSSFVLCYFHVFVMALDFDFHPFAFVLETCHLSSALGFAFYFFALAETLRFCDSEVLFRAS
jgi:hypothetical protein